MMAVGMSTALFSCAYDNMDAPGSRLKGQITYQGEPISVEKPSGNDPAVYFELWENKRTPIRVAVAQDGSFSAMLFNGNYKLIIPSGQGPFRSILNEETQSDTIPLRVGGSKTLNIEVLPYYMVRNVQMGKNGDNIEASFALEKIITDVNAKDVERVSLYLNKSTFVDGATNLRVVDLAGGSIADLGDIDLSASIPTMVPAQDYIFARVGVKIAGVSDMLYSPVQKIQF